MRCGICGVPLTKMMSPDGLSCLRCDRMKRDVRQRAFARQKTAKMIAGIWDPMIGIHERDSVLGRELLDGWESVDRQLSVFHELCLLGRDAAESRCCGRRSTDSCAPSRTRTSAAKGTSSCARRSRVSPAPASRSSEPRAIVGTQAVAPRA